MNNSLFMLVIFWGVWIIIPVLFDGFSTFLYMIVILIKAPKPHKHTIKKEELPQVSIIIPTFNEEENINECLNYLKIQNYPQEKIEIIVVDNGSTDKTSAIVKSHMREAWQNIHNKNNGNNNHSGKIRVNGNSFDTKDYQGVIRLIIRNEQGKAKALNTGIQLAKGEIIINIDCRSFLAPDAVYNMVAKFIENPEYGAATGNIEIDWNMVYARDRAGNYVLDEAGNFQPLELSHKEKFLGKSQFLEYLTAFRLGRQFQDITDSIYTFSGAFTAFRREVLLKSKLYRLRTVAEDTDFTLDLQGQNIRLGFVEDAIAYLKPVLSFERFYGQRVRWHRGEIEVIGLHLDWYGNFRKKPMRALWHSLLLMIDHTFSFPRIMWTFLLPLFFLFGYSVTLIVEAIALMYALYIFIDFVNALFCYRVVNEETKDKIKDSIQYCILTPIFRLIAFYSRFAAFLEVIKEPQAWSTRINPVRSVKSYGSSIKNGYQKVEPLASRIWFFFTGKKLERHVYDEKIAEFDDFGTNRDEISDNIHAKNNINNIQSNSNKDKTKS